MRFVPLAGMGRRKKRRHVDSVALYAPFNYLSAVQLFSTECFIWTYFESEIV